MRRSAILVPIALLISSSAMAQTRHSVHRTLDVSVCDLVSQPERYNGELVRVRSRIAIAFEDFTLSDKDCAPLEQQQGTTGVWLIYGGDEGSPTIYCCDDHSRKPGEVIEVEGHPIPLLRDEQLLEFRRRITAQRQARPDGMICQGRECYFYDVTATITGHFFAMEQTKDGETVGYGHLGMFHALFIEQVADVDARRRGVPIGGIFECKTEKWDVPPAQAEEIVREYKDCHDRKSCDAAGRRARTMGVEHWGESLEQVELWSEGSGGEAESYWSSPDLLTTLNFKFPYTNPYVKTSRSEFTVTRTRCSPIAKPLPQSANVNCDTQGRSVDDPESIAKIAQKEVDRGVDPWRTDFQKAAWAAVRDFAAKTSLTLSSSLEVESCQAYPVKENEHAYCRWISRDGMQAVDVEVVRYGNLTSGSRPKERTVWVERGVGFSTCKAE